MGLVMAEPKPVDPTCPRYSSRPFPSYRFVPGQRPHPRKFRQGQPYVSADQQSPRIAPEQWHRSDQYLYGIDLYNYAYWWECHEVFEGLWHAAGRTTDQGNFFQAVIQLAAANLKLFMGSPQAAQNLLRSALLRLQKMPETYYMGIDVTGLIDELQGCMMRPHQPAPGIRLNMPCQENEPIRTSAYR